MKKLCLLASVVVLIAGCASPSGTASGTDGSQVVSRERASNDDLPTGSLIRRKKSEPSKVQTVTLDRQAEADR